jgi:hypothetical protein
MRFSSLPLVIIVFLGFLSIHPEANAAGAPAKAEEVTMPLPLSAYKADGKEDGMTVMEKLKHRIEQDPFNLAATIIFFLAILHTFLAVVFQRWSHHLEVKHREKLEKERRTAVDKPYIGAQDDVSFGATALHFLGEIEAVFGIWVVALAGAAVYFHGWHDFETYVTNGVHFGEPLFVFVIMAIAASRPILRFSESVLSIGARLGGKTVTAWWFVILTIGPVLGSFITEPGAMTISAMLLARKFYKLNPSSKLAYGTLGLLFVNVSLGGTLTSYAAPPILMVAGPDKFNWSSSYVFMNLGVSSISVVLLSTILYLLAFRKELHDMEKRRLQLDSDRETSQQSHWADRNVPIPAWIILVHIFFLAWTVFTVHATPLCIGGFLFYLAFMQATHHHQNQVALRPPLLVSFFLMGLVIHGGCQGWWIEPVISSLGPWPMMIGSTILTSFNDNAAITYLGSQVPNLDPHLQHALVAGAIAGGGLTVIANAPNPAGQSILSKFFPGGINPLGLLLGAAIPTLIAVPVMMMLHEWLGIMTYTK